MLKRFKSIIIIIPLAVASFFVSSYTDNFFEISKNLDIFITLFKELNLYYVDETQPGKLMEEGINGMLESLDPYTTYIPESDIEDYRFMTTGQYGGIGALIRTKGDRVIVAEPYEGFPAQKAGLMAGDEILEINGKSTEGKSTNDVSSVLKGQPNTEVKVKIKRIGIDKPFDKTILREEVQIKSVPYFGMLEPEIGYVNLSSFTDNCAKEVADAVTELKTKGMKKLVLDLRGNPGGLLKEAVTLSNLFVDKGEQIVNTKGKVKDGCKNYVAMAQPMDTDMPIAVLVNSGSASASEIVAGVLQDLDRGVVLGCRSFGKGLVQRPLDLSYGTQVKVTISRYYTPSGRCIQALDYSKKDENGKAIKKTQNEFNAFKTKAGRTVYDGGGVLPDIEIAATKMANSTDALLKNDAIFNFATQLYYKNPTVNGVPVVSDTDFIAFKNYLKQEKINLDSDTHKALKTVLENAKKEKIEGQIAAEYKQLELALEKSQEAELDKNKEQIKKQLQEELIIRHQYREGLYLFYTKNNPEIEQAINLLNNSAQYASILKK